MNLRKKKILIGLFLFLIGVGLIVWAGMSFSSYLSNKKTYVKSYAIVIDFKEKDGFYNGYFEDGELYAPIIEYVVNGRSYIKTLNEYSNYPKYLEGDRVLIRYNPKNPDKYILEFDFSFIWIGLIGLIFSAVGCLAIFVKEKGSKIAY